MPSDEKLDEKVRRVLPELGAVHVEEGCIFYGNTATVILLRKKMDSLTKDLKQLLNNWEKTDKRLKLDVEEVARTPKYLLEVGARRDTLAAMLIDLRNVLSSHGLDTSEEGGESSKDG